MRLSHFTSLRYTLKLVSDGSSPDSQPRWMMSKVHCSPEDAVEVHVDVKSRKSVGEYPDKQVARQRRRVIVQ